LIITDQDQRGCSWSSPPQLAVSLQQASSARAEDRDR
jgi:hypothetical protein